MTEHSESTVYERDFQNEGCVTARGATHACSFRRGSRIWRTRAGRVRSGTMDWKTILEVLRMKGCHDCEHAPRIAAHDFDGVEWERTPCASCPQLKEDAASLHTIEFVEKVKGPIRWPPPDETAVADRLPISVLAEALRGFLELPQRTFRIVQRRLKGDSYSVIAQELEVTPQAVEIQLKRALEAHPFLRSILPAKARKQEARKRQRRSMARRGKPGCVT